MADALTPERLAELRRLTEAAQERGLPWSPPFTIEESLFLSAVPPDVVLALLDRLEAAEARTVELVNELDDERVAYAELLAERDPRAELVQVGWGGCVGHSTCEVDEGHEWYLRCLDDKHELVRDHPIWPVYARRAVPAAVAGEPEARWCAHQRDGWCAVVPDAEPAEGSSVDTACGFHIPLPGGFEHRTPTCPDCLAALRSGEPESTPAAPPDADPGELAASLAWSEMVDARRRPESTPAAEPRRRCGTCLDTGLVPATGRGSDGYEPCPACVPAAQPEEKLVDLMGALETSVREAKEARKHHPRAADTQEAP